MTSGTQTRDQSAYFPTDQEYDGLLRKRTRRALFAQRVYDLGESIALPLSGNRLLELGDVLEVPIE